MTSKTLTFNVLIVILFVLLWNDKNHFKTHAFQEILPSKTFKKTNKRLLPKHSSTCHHPSFFLSFLRNKNFQSRTTAIFFYASSSSSFKSLSNDESELILNQSTKQKETDTTNNNKQEDKVVASDKVPTTFFKPAHASNTRNSHKQYPNDFDEFIQQTTIKYRNDDLVDIPKLKQNKQSWWTQFKELYQYFLKRGYSNVPNKWKKNRQLADWVNAERVWYRKKLDLLPSSNNCKTSTSSNNNYQFYFNNTYDKTRYELMNEIQFQWVIQPKYSLKQFWLERYHELCEYVDEHGNANVPRRYKDNPQLGGWVSNERKWYKQDYPKEKLNLDSNVTDLYLKACVAQQRVDLLENIGFQWSLRKSNQIPANRKKWYERLEQLKLYKKQFGHTNVPQHWETNKSLGVWVFGQRQWYRKFTNKDGKLIEYNQAHQERINLLNEIGFEWNPGSRKELDKVWMEMYNELLEYHAEHGHGNVPKLYPPNPSLGRWVQTQRTWHKNVIKKGTKQQEEIEELANVIQGKKERGDLDDPFINSSATSRGCHIGKECIHKRIELLNEIGFNWTGQTGPTWHDQYEELAKFKKEHGHTNVPSNWKPNKKLGGWISNQRKWYKMNTDENGDLLDSKDPIKMERIKLMNEIGFEWRLNRKSRCSKIQPSWMERYNELCDYVNRFEHANVPYGWTENVKLASWINNQRTDYNKMKQNGLLKTHQVMQQKVKLLNNIGFKWYALGDSSWWLMYNKLIMYMEQNNNSLSGLATSSYVRQDLQLYQFVYRLRQHVKEYISKVKQNGTTSNVETKQLDKEQVEALRRINFCWLPRMEKGKDGTLSVLCLDDEPIDGDDIMGWSKEEVKEFEGIDLESLFVSKESSIEGNFVVNEIVSNNGQFFGNLDGDEEDDNDDNNNGTDLGRDFGFDWRSTD